MLLLSITNPLETPHIVVDHNDNYGLNNTAGTASAVSFPLT